MGFFSKREKKKKGWFGKKSQEEEPVSDLTLAESETSSEEPEEDLPEEAGFPESEAEEIATEALEQQQARKSQWEQEAVQQALSETEAVQQEAAALAAQAAQEARKAAQASQQDPFETEYTPLATKREEPEASEELEETEEPEEPEEPAEEPVQKRKGLFAKIREGLKKTKDSMIARVQHVLSGFTKIDEDLFEQLEETLILSDLGPETSVEICDLLRERVKERGVTDPRQIMGMIQEIIEEMLGEDTPLDLSTKPSVILVIGVNGVGKTTTIGKLCYQLKNEGKKVIVAAADTFRAAAIDQLEVWTTRAGVDLVKHAEGSDPGAVVFDAVAAAKARDCDVLICDTAGRLHNKKNLMQELAKINRILETQAQGCSVEVLLVLDATTGQNAVNQARLFQEVANLTGIVLTKLDGTAKGGIVISIRNELHIPVKLIGVGEKIDDLQPFCGKDFASALFERETEEL